MEFLARVAAYLLTTALGALALKVVAWVKSIKARQDLQKQLKNEAEKSVEPLKNAKTSEEIDRAARDSLDKF